MTCVLHSFEPPVAVFPSRCEAPLKQMAVGLFPSAGRDDIYVPHGCNKLSGGYYPKLGGRRHKENQRLREKGRLVLWVFSCCCSVEAHSCSSTSAVIGHRYFLGADIDRETTFSKVQLTNLSVIQLV